MKSFSMCELKADRPHPRDKPPTSPYGVTKTDNDIICLHHQSHEGQRSNGSNRRALTNTWMDGRYQMHYLPALLKLLGVSFKKSHIGMSSWLGVLVNIWAVIPARPGFRWFVSPQIIVSRNENGPLPPKEWPSTFAYKSEECQQAGLVYLEF